MSPRSWMPCGSLARRLGCVRMDFTSRRSCIEVLINPRPSASRRYDRTNCRMSRRRARTPGPAGSVARLAARRDDGQRGDCRQSHRGGAGQSEGPQLAASRHREQSTARALPGVHGARRRCGPTRRSGAGGGRRAGRDGESARRLAARPARLVRPAQPDSRSALVARRGGASPRKADHARLVARGPETARPPQARRRGRPRRTARRTQPVARVLQWLRGSSAPCRNDVEDGAVAGRRGTCRGSSRGRARAIVPPGLDGCRRRRVRHPRVSPGRHGSRACDRPSRPARCPHGRSLHRVDRERPLARVRRQRVPAPARDPARPAQSR